MRQEKNNDVNCAGTALYFAGLIDSHRFVHPKIVADKYLSRMPKTQEPTQGCVVVFRYPGKSTWVKHMSLLVGTNPRKVTHRLHSGETLRENQDLEQLMAECEVQIQQMEFYEPKFID